MLQTIALLKTQKETATAAADAATKVGVCIHILVQYYHHYDRIKVLVKLHHQ